MAEFDPTKPFEVIGPTPVISREPEPRAEFDPTKPFEVVEQGPKAEFDPSKPHETVDNRPMPGWIDALTQGVGSGIKGVGQTAGLAAHLRGFDKDAAPKVEERPSPVGLLGQAGPHSLLSCSTARSRTWSSRPLVFSQPLQQPGRL
jgi:hypothetical protein